ncbi:MAG: DHH family phosphoesterase [Clostridia bacterium]|nr:DHH family phosphoesterase [Clostridia bacterium]
MNEFLSIPFPFVKLNKELKIVDYNANYKDWSKNLKEVKTIFDLMSEFDVDKPKQKALIGDSYYDLYTKACDEGFNVIFIENPYINRQGQPASNILVGILLVDNSLEIQETMDEIRFPHFSAIIERKINDYFNNMGGLVRRFESGKYLFVLNKEMLKKLREDKFSIVDQIGKIEMGNDVPATLSIGIGMNGNTVNEDMAFARGALDLALGRGGNQIVIKESEDTYQFVGGDGKEVSKNSRVRARVKAYGLVELILSASDVIIMGHKNPDLDSLGSAAGIFAIANFYDKKCHIVLNRVTSSVNVLYERLCDDGRYENAFINSEEAQSMIKRRTLLIVVDTHRPFLTECPELLDKAKTIVMIDHHRKSTGAIDNCALVYHEAYSSSTCEMVTEMLMYIKGIRLSRTEIEGLLAGITIDTKNFAFKTGIKTFEAAAYLKKNGADTISVRRLFKNSFDEYLARSEIIRTAEIIYDNMAISVLDENIQVDNPTLLIAQAADELLGIRGIEVSYVLCEFCDKIHISARSLGKVNVQKLMEKLGGGGHQAGAAAQLENVTMEEAIEILKEKIEEYLKENE